MNGSRTLIQLHISNDPDKHLIEALHHPRYPNLPEETHLLAGGRGTRCGLPWFHPATPQAFPDLVTRLPNDKVRFQQPAFLCSLRVTKPLPIRA